MVSCRSGHVQIAAYGPLVAGGVANSDGDEHQGALVVGKAAHDAGATSDLPVQQFNHVVGADPSTVLDRRSSLMAPSSRTPSLYRVLAGTWAEMMLPAKYQPCSCLARRRPSVASAPALPTLARRDFPSLMEGSGASRTIYCYDVQLSHMNGTQLLGQRIPVAFHSTYRHS